MAAKVLDTIKLLDCGYGSYNLKISSEYQLDLVKVDTHRFTEELLSIDYHLYDNRELELEEVEDLVDSCNPVVPLCELTYRVWEIYQFVRLSGKDLHRFKIILDSLTYNTSALELWEGIDLLWAEKVKATTALSILKPLPLTIPTKEC